MIIVQNFIILLKERKMAYLFESFVRNFYKKELRGAKVYREDMYWELTGEFVEFLPKM